MNWHKYPFIRLLVPYAAGIWIALSFSSLRIADFNFIIVFMLLFLAIAIVVSKCVKAYSRRWMFGLIVNFYLVLLGFAMVSTDDFRLNKRHISNRCDEDGIFIARLFENVTEKEKTAKAVLEIIGVTDSSGFHEVDGKIIAYFEKDTAALSLKYGDIVSFVTAINGVGPPRNPEQFDYKRYLERKGIAGQVYLKTGTWLYTGASLTNPIYRFSYWMCDFLLETMKSLGIDGDEFAVAAAILLGYDDCLPAELRQGYVAAGSMHILCVSGMHVGVVFLLFSYILSFLERKRHTLKQCILLVLIWFYALLAGLAPSILRATTMLSFIIIGDLLKRKGVTMNSVAASAFILLVLKPPNLLDVGFQLSYIAVIGIVVLQRPIFNLLYVKWKPICKIWEISSVTLAAQAATAPFSIFYFHQFPVYFWLSNLFMTPLSSVVIVGGMAMLLLSFIPYINNVVAWCVSRMIFVMNLLVNKIESLPMSIVKGLYVSDFEFFLLLMALLFLFIWVSFGTRKMVVPLMSVTLFFCLSQLKRAVDQMKSVGFTVYAIDNHTAIDFVCGREHVLLADSALLQDKSAISFSMENDLIRRGLYRSGTVLPLDKDGKIASFLEKKGDFISFNGKLIALYGDGHSDKLIYQPKIKADFLILHGNKKRRLEELCRCYDFGFLIVDGSISAYKSSDLRAELDKNGVKYHSVSGGKYYDIWF